MPEDREPVGSNGQVEFIGKLAGQRFVVGQVGIKNRRNYVGRVGFAQRVQKPEGRGNDNTNQVCGNTFVVPEVKLFQVSESAI